MTYGPDGHLHEAVAAGEDMQSTPTQPATGQSILYKEFVAEDLNSCGFNGDYVNQLGGSFNGDLRVNQQRNPKGDLEQSVETVVRGELMCGREIPQNDFKTGTEFPQKFCQNDSFGQNDALFCTRKFDEETEKRLMHELMLAAARHASDLSLDFFHFRETIQQYQADMQFLSKDQFHDLNEEFFNKNFGLNPKLGFKLFAHRQRKRQSSTNSGGTSGIAANQPQLSQIASQGLEVSWAAHSNASHSTAQSDALHSAVHSAAPSSAFHSADRHASAYSGGAVQSDFTVQSEVTVHHCKPSGSEANNLEMKDLAKTPNKSDKSLSTMQTPNSIDKTPKTKTQEEEEDDFFDTEETALQESQRIFHSAALRAAGKIEQQKRNHQQIMCPIRILTRDKKIPSKEEAERREGSEKKIQVLAKEKNLTQRQGSDTRDEEEFEKEQSTPKEDILRGLDAKVKVSKDELEKKKQEDILKELDAKVAREELIVKDEHDRKIAAMQREIEKIKRDRHLKKTGTNLPPGLVTPGIGNATSSTAEPGKTVKNEQVQISRKRWQMAQMAQEQQRLVQQQVQAQQAGYTQAQAQQAGYTHAQHMAQQQAQATHPGYTQARHQAQTQQLAHQQAAQQLQQQAVPYQLPNGQMTMVRNPVVVQPASTVGAGIHPAYTQAQHQAQPQSLQYAQAIQARHASQQHAAHAQVVQAHQVAQKQHAQAVANQQAQAQVAAKHHALMQQEVGTHQAAVAHAQQMRMEQQPLPRQRYQAQETEQAGIEARIARAQQDAKNAKERHHGDTTRSERQSSNNKRNSHPDLTQMGYGPPERGALPREAGVGVSGLFATEPGSGSRQDASAWGMERDRQLSWRRNKTNADESVRAV